MDDFAPKVYRFREFELDIAAYQLRRNGAPARLERRPMELLVLLVERHGTLVTREEIIERLWPKKTVIDFDTGLNTLVRKVRQALEDSPEAPYVETVPGKGYRFVAPVELDDRAAVRTSPPTSAPSRRARNVALLLGFLACIAIVSWAWRSGEPEERHVTIAVLPFDNLSGSREHDYLAEGLAEETGTFLGQVDPKRLQVISRMSASAFKRSGKPVAESRAELGADYVVESSLRAERDQVRVTVRLTRVDDQVQLWAASFDRALTSTLGVQQDIGSAIAQQVRIALSPQRAAEISRRQTQNQKAYDLYLRGRYEWMNLTPTGNRRALEYYERAIEEDRDYALAWAGIATVLAAAPINSDVEPATVRERARNAARHAIEANPDLAEAHFAQGYVQFMLDWQWPDAEKHMRRAIQIDPNYAMAHLVLGHVLSQIGQQAEAREMTRRARELDPLYAHMYAISAQIAYQGREYADALEYARQSTVIAPKFWIAHIQLAQALQALGRVDEALQSFEAAARYSDNNSKALAFSGYALAAAGRTTQAREILRVLAERSSQRYLPPYTVAMVYAGLGEHDAALEWLERAYEHRDIHLVFLPVDARWDALRRDARFSALMQRCEFGSAPRLGLRSD
jgi:TolB-like protein/DNA-binding winged helix-turn-helix (wHTH) protein/Tfp pilus assembly protein PilF